MIVSCDMFLFVNRYFTIANIYLFIYIYLLRIHMLFSHNLPVLCKFYFNLDCVCKSETRFATFVIVQNKKIKIQLPIVCCFICVCVSFLFF